MAQDGAPREVRIGGHRLRLTSPDRVLYPTTGTTKTDVVDYYTRIAAVMLPHCAGRPVTRKRWPNGVGTPTEPGEVFFQKNLGSGVPDWVARVDIEHRDHVNTYPLANDVATLAWFAQLAALEVHVPQWRVGSDGRPRPPDRLVLDLDPGEGTGLPECVEVARLARDLLEGMGLDPVPATSGSKGVHIYAALDGTSSSDEVSAVAHELARTLESEHPDLVVSEMKKEVRRGRVFIDWSQNSAAKTTIAPYSLRGRERPMVAAPRTWRELLHPRLRQLDYLEVLDRVERRGDPMAELGRAADRSGGTPARDRLEVYRARRDAGKTPEPVPPDAGRRAEGEQPAQSEELTFVIQEHHARRLHWDFRLARDGVLVSWALPKGVPMSTSKNHLAVQTEDHPMEYGSFAGTIPAGEYGAGTVTIWDHGSYEAEKWREGKEIIATLTGQPDGGLAGPDGPGRSSHFAFIHTGGRSAGEDNHWLIHLMAATTSASESAADSGDDPDVGSDDDADHDADHDADDGSDDDAGREGDACQENGDDRDGAGRNGDDGRAREADREDDAAGEARGGAGGRSQRRAPGGAAGGESRGAEFIEPMLATLAEPADVDTAHDWAVEMKWDGIRAVVIVHDGELRLVSRTGRDMTATYPELADLPEQLSANQVVLDGEIVALTAEGRPDFGLLQQRMQLTDRRAAERAAAASPVRLMLFDALEVDGRSLLRRSYDERREVLENVVEDGRLVMVPPVFDGDLDAAVDASRQWRLEGVIAKRRGSRYSPGRRSRSWLKIKHVRTQEAVVVGWRPGRGSRAGKVGSLLLGVPDADGLRYIGRVGTGFSEREAGQWVTELERARRKTPPLDVPRPESTDAQWVTPNRVAEVEFAEWTSSGRLRQPRWRGWRPDKNADDVVLDG